MLASDSLWHLGRWFGRNFLLRAFSAFSFFISCHSRAHFRRCSVHVVAGIFYTLHTPNSCVLEFQVEGGAATKASIAQRAHLPPATRGSLLSSSCRQSWQGPPSIRAYATRTSRSSASKPAKVAGCFADQQHPSGSSSQLNTACTKRSWPGFWNA